MFPNVAGEEKNPLDLIKGLKLVIRNDLPDIGFLTLDGIEEKEWTDGELMLKGGLKLSIKTVDELYDTAKNFWSLLSKEVTVRGVGEMMLLAWNIRSPTSQTEAIFRRESYFSTPDDVDIVTLRNAMIFGGKTEPPDLSGIPKESLVISSCYTAASLLRLFTKRPESWKKAFREHLKEGYSKFYKRPYPIKHYMPSDACVERIWQTLQNLPVFKGTLGRFLYNYHYLDADKGICTMLFEQHVRLTGMHSLSLFVRAAAGLHASTQELASACQHRQTSNGLRTILDILGNVVPNQGVEGTAHERGTWKYSRIFGNEYFVKIQSKQCSALICTLATICELLGLAENQNIMDIASVKRLPASTQEIYKLWGKRIHTYFTSEPVSCKDRLLEYTRRSRIPSPVYQTVNEGSQSAPQYKSTVLVDEVCYASLIHSVTEGGAEQDAARIALEYISKKAKDDAFILLHKLGLK